MIISESRRQALTTTTTRGPNAQRTAARHVFEVTDDGLIDQQQQQEQRCAPQRLLAPTNNGDVGVKGLLSRRAWAAWALRLLLCVRGALTELFLPLGFPESVRPEYLRFQMWDTVQALCSYLRGILATSAVLETAGVGSEKATAIAAAINWILRDGLGMCTGMVFTFFTARMFDEHIKAWRLFADVINDVGLLLDMISPLTGAHSFAVTCVATCCKTMCGVAAGATRASITVHFALDNNMADLSAKESTQETAVTLLGLVLGVCVAKNIDSKGPCGWFIFIFFTLVHVYANYMGVRALSLVSLNRQRVDILFAAQQSDGGGSMAIEDVAREESLMYVVSRLLTTQPVVLGCRGEDIRGVKNLRQHLSLYEHDKFAIICQDGRAYVLLHDSVGKKEVLRGYYLALWMLLRHRPSMTLAETRAAIASGGRAFNDFVALLVEKGWDTSQVLLGESDIRLTIDYSNKKKDT